MIKTFLILVSSLLFARYLAGMPGQSDAVRGWESTEFVQQAPQERDSLTRLSLKFAGYPVLGYTPETRIMGGIYTHLLAGMPGTDRLSGVGLGVLGSQNRQFSLNLLPEIWWDRSHFHLAGELKWQYWPDRFYGIGNDTRKEDREYYVSRIWGVKLDLLRSAWRDFYAGILLEVEHNNIVEYDTVAYAVLPGGSIPGSDRSTISGMGLGLAWDSRQCDWIHLQPYQMDP
jgi:hypothetical protein